MRLAWVPLAFALALPAGATARVQRRYVCANQAVLDQAPGRHPFDNLERGDRFLADRFARGGDWAHGTPVSYALSRRPIRRGRAQWVRVADLCPRGTLPWSALPPANAASSFLGARLAAGPAGIVYLSDGGELVRLAVSRAGSGGLALRGRALGHAPSTAFAAGAGRAPPRPAPCPPPRSPPAPAAGSTSAPSAEAWPCTPRRAGSRASSGAAA